MTAMLSRDNRDSLDARTSRVLDALQTLADAGWTVTGIAEHEQDGVRVRATFYTSHSPTVGVSREIGGIRQHLYFDGCLPGGPTAAVAHAIELADASARWAVTQ